MAAIRCEASGCGSTESSGKIFYQCKSCLRWWCSDHGAVGRLCPACKKGYMKKA